MLKGKTALVTGPTSGIGLAIARVMFNGFGDAGAIEQVRVAIETGFGVNVRFSNADMNRPRRLSP